MSAEATGDFVELGEVIGGYRLERVLGAGSTSHVFLGKHVVLGRKAAIKVLVHKLIGNEDVISRLLTEAKAVNDIKHPNIIDISDFINTMSPRRVALVMEYIEGPSLTICRDHPLTFEQAIGIMLQLVAAVRAAHAAGVIHRDIKPDNLLLTTDPRQKAKEVPALKIVDFGIAKMATSNLAQTAVGTMLGTPAYMAPEQIAGRPRPSAATDVFAIGEVLYEVLTSKRAYPAGTISETVRTKLRGELPDLKLPPMPGDKALLGIIKRCLAHRPEDRPGLQEITSVLESVRPGGERIETLEDLEDVDASEIDTRMVDHKPLPPLALTELTPMSIASMIDPGPTDANPLPRPRFPKDITSPTNRVLPALSEIPNAPTVPGALEGAAQLIRDEQSLSIGEIRIDDFRARPSDDEASVQISELQMSRMQGPITVENNADDLRKLGLSQPAGLQSFDRETELDGLDSGDDLIESSMPTPFNERVEPRKPTDDGAVTMPPPPLPPPASPRSESGLDTPDTRITEVRPSAPASNRLLLVLIGAIGFATTIGILVATGRIDLTSDAPVAPPPAQVEEPPPKKSEVTVAARPGRFLIESEPANADVLAIYAGSDPLPLGKTPLEFGFSGDNLPETLRIVHPEYDPVEVEVTAENNHIAVKLTKK